MTIIYCDFIAGCIGGACGTLIGHPLDTIKTWQQAANIRISTSMYNIIIRNNGLNGFYRGMMFPLCTSGMINSILFGIYGNELRRLQTLCEDDAEKKKKWRQNVFIAGSEAGFIQTLIACPIELIKIRLQTQNYFDDYRKGATRGPLMCIKHIYHRDGLYGFYRGITPMICRDVFPYGIYMITYEHINHMLVNSEWVKEMRKDELNKYLEVSLTILSGAIAGIMSWVLVIPFDVMKTIIQADPDKFTNMRHYLAKNLNRSDWRILFRGSWMLIVRSIPTNAATFLCYEYALRHCQIYANTTPITFS